MACSPLSPAGSATATGAASQATASSGDDGGHATHASTAATDLSSGTSTTVPGDSSGAPTTTGGHAFIEPLDLPPSDTCDPYAQDCPLGQKCTVLDGFADTHCVDIIPEPRGLGETCTLSDYLLSGHDDCALGLVCWEVDPDTGVGTCHALCTGSPDSPTCADPARHCWPICQSCWFGICLGGCDPRLADCPNGHVCVPEYYGTHGDFLCQIDNSDEEGQYGDPCEWYSTCDPGLYCAAVAAVPGCPPGDGCCAPFCDTDAPDCPDADLGVACLSWYDPGDAPPGLEDLGLCVLPP